MLTSRRQICRYAAGDAEVPGPAIVLIRLWLNLRTHHERRLIEQHTGEQTHLV